MEHRLGIIAGSLLVSAVIANGQGSTEELKRELELLRSDYQSRIERLEARIRELEEGERRPATRRSNWSATAEEMDAAMKREEEAAAKLESVKRSVDKSFEENTETRDIARNRDAERMLAERVEDVLEGYMDISGYFRAGYGRSGSGGPQRAFGIPGVAKYRLGNEAENYGEVAFAKTFYPSGIFGGSKGGGVNDPVARFVYRMSFVNPYDDYGSGADTEFASPELWGSVGNVIPGMPEAKFWAGNRYYRRHDIHMNDFYFWDMSGGGGGVEDVPLGPGKLAVAWIGDGAESAIYSQIGMRDPVNVAGFSKTNIDIRYYDWNFLGGTGEVGLVLADAKSGLDVDGNKAEDAQGVALSLVRTTEGFLDAESLHKSSLQVGTGPAKTFTSGFETFSDASGTYIRPDPEDSWRFRATDQLVIKPWDCLALGTTLVYQYTDFGDDTLDQHWVSGGIRPVWFFTDSISLAFEGGVDWISDTLNGPGGTLGKLTLAPQVSLGDQFFSRPVLRAFVTYATWSDGLRGEVGGIDYADDTDGWSWGLQMEAWW